MAEIKYLSAGSSQIFALLLRDKNKAPINANKIHMEGIIYTGNNKDKGYRFSINNGVVLGCTIQLDMIIFNINPLLPVIQTVQVYFSKEDSTGINPIEQTRTSFESKTAEAPKYISTNKGSAFQPIEFKKGEFIWLYAICNYDDGAYFNSVKKGQYLIQTIIEWEGIEESPVVPLKNISELKFTKDGKEVASDNYGLEIDIDTGKITVTTK